jgi:hypothetical protein
MKCPFYGVPQDGGFNGMSGWDEGFLCGRSVVIRDIIKGTQ